MDSVKWMVNLTTSQCMEMFAKRRHIQKQQQEKLFKIGTDEDFSISVIKRNTRRLDLDIQNQHNETLVNLFQDFVLEFNRLYFTKGKRKLLLYTVLKAEGDIFQELREYDKAIRAYKSLKNFCDIWQMKFLAMMMCEQIGLCYRLMRMHRLAVDFFKKQLQLCWDIESERDELISYYNIATEYYYIGDMQKMRLYEERFM